MKPEPLQTSPDPLSDLLRWALIAVVGVAVSAGVAVLAYVFVFHQAGWSPDPAAWGEFGDFLGGLINPIVGIVTVFLVFLSISIQRREFKQSNDALAAQNAAIRLQSFEQTFFAWLSNYRDLVSSVTSEDRVGRDALLLMWATHLSRNPVRDRLRGMLTLQDYENAIRPGGGIPDAETPKILELLLQSWQVIYNESEHHLDSMFRTLYRLIRWVDERPETLLSADQKWHYISIVRAQLSRVEMLYLFYNGFTGRGHRFAKYINKYALFDNLDDNDDFALRLMRQLDESPFDAEAYDSDLAREQLGRPKQ